MPSCSTCRQLWPTKLGNLSNEQKDEVMEWDGDVVIWFAIFLCVDLSDVFGEVVIQIFCPHN